MTTKIDAYSAAAASGQTGAVRPANTAPHGGSSGGSVQRVDSVKLTPDAMQLHDLEKTIASVPVTNRERVAQVRQSIAGGTYKIDPKAVASKLTRMEWDLARTS
ncbi:MAG: flagellar biosynthesis anti-sigma factor FlgM [Nevskiaceae bacterium]|nr:MAG: flagellar biosynthesis anti-sigma factor FlgM [Nevskiaceae bacterium]